MAKHERRTEREGDQQNEHDRSQAAIGGRLPLPGMVGLLRTMPTSVEKSVFERPVFRQIHPTVVLVLPAAVPQLVNQTSRENGLREGGDPQPFMIGNVGG